MCQLLIECPLRQPPRQQVLCSQCIHMLAMITGNHFVVTFDSVPTSMNPHVVWVIYPFPHMWAANTAWFMQPPFVMSPPRSVELLFCQFVHLWAHKGYVCCSKSALGPIFGDPQYRKSYVAKSPTCGSQRSVACIATFVHVRMSRSPGTPKVL